MVCESCNNSKKSSNDFTRAVIEIDNPDKLVLLRKVVIPASMGTKDDFPPTIGKYYNTLLQYEASGDLYLYSSDGIPTQLSSDVSELQRQLEQLGLKVDKEILDRIAADAALNNSINTVSGSLSDEVTARQNADNALQGNITALDNSLATVAKSGSYNDLSNKPTIGNATLTIKKNGSNVGTFTANATANKNIDISVPTKTSDLTNDGSDGTSTYVETKNLPTIGNATLTIQKNGTNVQTFTANSSTNKTANITVPTAVSELTNDANYATTTQLNDGLATKQNTLTAGGNITITNDTISATDTTYTAGNAIEITNNVISADIYPADFFTAGKNVSGEGIDITLNNTINAPIQELELQGDTYQQTYSGKNLFDSSSYATKSDSGDVSLGVGSVRMTQTVVGNAGGNCYVGFDINKPELRDKEVVIFMKAVSGGGSTGSRVRVVTMPAQSDIGSLAPTSSGSALKFTIPSDGAIRIYFYANASNVAGVVGAYTEYTNIQLEVGDTATAYEPYCGGTASPNPDYPQAVQTVTGEQTVTVTGDDEASQSYTINLGSTELCKIGDYQDYIYKSGDDWYVHKEVGKASANGRTWEWASVGRYFTRTSYGNNYDNSKVNVISERFKGVARQPDPGAASYPYIVMSGEGNIGIRNPDITGSGNISAFTTWLDSLNTSWYYVLATPTNTKITDATLVEQLEALWNANTYLDTTHFFVTATGNNLPVILDIEAYRKSLDGVLESIPDAQVQSNWTQADSTAVDYIKNKPSLATVATSGSYNDLANKPTIPTVNDATLTIKKNGSTVTTFTANSSTNQTADISVPVITMTTTDPGEGSPLAANNFIGVYE